MLPTPVVNLSMQFARQTIQSPQGVKRLAEGTDLYVSTGFYY